MSDVCDASECSSGSSSTDCEDDDTSSSASLRSLWAVAYVYAHDGQAGRHSSLRLLVEVVRERRWASARGGCDAVAAGQKALVQRLLPLPLPVLVRCLRQLQEGRAYWERHVWRPCARQLAAARARVARERGNALRYHVSLWQRRHPLGLVREVLALPRTHMCDAQMLTNVSLDALLEALTAHLYPHLARLPWLIRCDVLLTYPDMPLEEQMALMHGLAQSSGLVQSSEGHAVPDLSAAAVTPQEMLRGYLPPEHIPQRGVDMLSDEAYAAVRAALERHKRDGVVRLSQGAYRPPNA